MLHNLPIASEKSPLPFDAANTPPVGEHTHALAVFISRISPGNPAYLYCINPADLYCINNNEAAPLKLRVTGV
jgi:hypothetical protein